jgi:hypothetical protein
MTDAMQTTSITIDPEIARRIREQVLEGFRLLPKRGVEVGGVLLGRFERENDPLPVHVDDFEPVSCEHRFGPSFTLSDEDRAGLEGILARRGREVVGYYRSCTGRELGLDASDEDLIRSYFSRSGHVCLCVAPVSARECVASVFSWREGQPPKQTMKAFLFDGAGASAQQELPAPERAAKPEAPQPAPEPEFPSPPTAARDRRLWPWLFVLVLAIGCAFLYEQWQAARQEWPSHLGLDVRQTESGLHLNWDASAPAVRKAGGGLLSIRHDGRENDVQLDAATVRGGSFAYKGSTDDVLFRLTVYGPEMQAATESFRIVAAAQPPPAIEPEPEPVQEPAPAAEVATPAPVMAPAVPPVPVHEVQPGISDGIRARIESPVVVPVDVQISASGRVASAVAQGGGDSLYRYLAERAAGAARSWRFQPARSRNGTAVPSSKTIYFVFRG